MSINYKVKIAFLTGILSLVFIIGRDVKLSNALTSSEQPKTPPIVSIDEFEYKNNDDIKKTWVAISSKDAKVDLSSDSAISSDLNFESTKSLKIESNVPTANPRYEQIMYIFSPEDWTTHGTSIEIWVKGDGIEQEPWGGEFSICLIDGGSKEDEIWQSTRWIDRKDIWKKITISLTGSGQGDPWKHPDDFVIPVWEKVRNGVLDKNKIKGIMIKSLTTEEVAGKYPGFTVWVDHLVRY